MRSIILSSLFILLLNSCSMNVFFYFPDKAEVIKSSKATEFYIPFKKEKSVHGIFFKKDKPRASIFILHGNGGNLTGWQSVAEMLWEDGYQTFIFDYPEYGNSDGQARHNQVIESSQKAFDYFKNLPEVEGTKKIVMGFSLGGNMALKIGHDNQESLDAMVLEGAFTNQREIGIYTTPKIFRFAPWLVLGSKFRGEELIRDWKKPLLVVHSTDDKVCPYEMGKEIYNNAGSDKKELWTIKGAHLQGFGLDSETYFTKIRKLITE